MPRSVQTRLMGPRVTVFAGKPAAARADVLVIPMRPGDTLQHLPAVLRRAVRQRMRQLSFTGDWAAAELFLLSARGVQVPFVAVVGLGNAKRDLSRQAEGMRRGMAKVAQAARRHSLRRAVLSLPGEGEIVRQLAAAAVDGVVLGSYRFSEYSSRARESEASRRLRQLAVQVDQHEVASVRRAVAKAETVLRGVRLARDLVNRPAAAVTPQALVDTARAIASRSRQISLRVLDKRKAAAERFSAFLSVAQGSSVAPYVIHLTYTPRRGRSSEPATRKIFLVGKGITFDSGGLSLKPADYMEAMKIDMAGAAAVLGIFSVLPSLALGTEVHGVIAACENMPSGTAYRPGDILTAKNGKTIEVLNTDAEGRITLADALSYAVEQKPDAVVDLATLTGACLIALGDTYAGLWSTDAGLRRKLLAAAGAVGEGLVSLPLPEEYKPMIESKVADVRNTATSKWGGAITAALFLREFVGSVPWAHLDIAGPAYAEHEWLPYNGVGATGYGVRTLISFLEHY